MSPACGAPSARKVQVLLGLLVPQAIPSMSFGARTFRCWVSGHYGIDRFPLWSSKICGGEGHCARGTLSHIQDFAPLDPGEDLRLEKGSHLKASSSLGRDGSNVLVCLRPRTLRLEGAGTHRFAF